MTTHDHIFIREPTLEMLESFCPHCRNPDDRCTCDDLPDYETALETYERSPH